MRALAVLLLSVAACAPPPVSDLPPQPSQSAAVVVPSTVASAAPSVAPPPDRPREAIGELRAFPIEFSSFGDRKTAQLKTSALAISEPVFEPKPDYLSVDLPVGPKSVVTCAFKPFHLDPLEMARSSLALLKKYDAVAKRASVEVIGGRPVLSFEIAYLEKGTGDELGSLKMMLATSSTGSILCSHAGDGYRATFQRIVRNLLETTPSFVADPHRQLELWTPTDGKSELVWDREATVTSTGEKEERTFELFAQVQGRDLFVRHTESYALTNKQDEVETGALGTSILEREELKVALKRTGKSEYAVEINVGGSDTVDKAAPGSPLLGWVGSSSKLRELSTGRQPKLSWSEFGGMAISGHQPVMRELSGRREHSGELVVGEPKSKETERCNPSPVGDCEELRVQGGNVSGTARRIHVEHPGSP